MDNQRVHLIISGGVQGVWFRASARDEAIRQGIVGWVKNRRDRNVEIVAEGTESQLETFIQWCHRGPELAEVDHVEVKQETSTGEFTEFEIT